MLITPYRSLQPPTAMVNWGHPITQGLRGAWLMNPGGTSLIDLVNGIPGVLTNGPTRGLARYGSRVLFAAASDQYVNAGNPVALQITGDITVATRYSLTSSPAVNASYQLVTKDKDTGGRAYTFDVYNNVSASLSGARWYVNGGTSGTGSIINEQRSPVAGDDRSVLGTYNTTGEMAFYLNGLLSGSLTGAGTSINTATANVLFGRREYVGYTEPLDGALYYVYIWARALTPSEAMLIAMRPTIVLALSMRWPAVKRALLHTQLEKQFRGMGRGVMRGAA